MTTIYNSDLTKELVEAAKIQVSRDKVPNQIAEKVVPVMEVNPKAFRRINIIKSSTSTNATLYTTPSDRDFFITNFIHSASSTAAGTNSLLLNAQLFGDSSVTVLSNVKLHNTALIDADSGSISAAFPIPIKLERGSAITITSAGTIAAARTTIYGYIVDNSSA